MSICRGCLVKEADVYQSLFSRIEMIPVQDMFQALTGLSVSREDGLPRYICQECCEWLLHFYKLRAKMIESNAFLQSSIAPSVAICDEYGGIKEEKGASNERSVSIMPVHTGSEHEQFSGDEIDSDEFVPPAEKRQRIAAIKIEPIENEEKPSMVLGGSQDELDDETSGTFYVDDYEDDNRSEYLTTDLEPEDAQSSLAANDAEAKEASPWIYCCGCENVRFNSKEELAQHTQEVHLKNRIFHNVHPHECSICYKRYLRYKWLKQHQAMPYRVRNYACKEPGCDARFFGRSALLSHTKSIHLRLRSYKCELCEKSFFTSGTLQSHRKIHTTKQYQCQTCRKMFLRQSDLLGHQTTHLDERPFSCKLCDKRFKSKNHLRNHQYVHTGERRLKCDHCDATFTTYNDRQVHLLGHENIDPYKCSYCDKVYKRNYKLQVHIRKAHTGERPFGCTQCTQKFYEKSTLTAHLRKEHGSANTEELAGPIEVMLEDGHIMEN
uniref:Uncharacterized protein n=1 Tax=Anopheles atroparvus TaxID=41427 RepID=A0AAG5CPP1_ANOAO